ncbi:MAG: MFS transporter, partial [Eggerthellaceae bacterium]|nr:MFS transporter [Eggerthellaceae bacterium]
MEKAVAAAGSKGNASFLPMLIVLFGAAFIAAFNENLMNVALISIMGDFSVTADAAQWLVTGYMIVTSIIVSITAFLSRRFSVRVLFFTACSIIAGGSIVCFFSPNFGVLLTFRTLQAIGSGICIPTATYITLKVVPLRQLGTYMAICNCMIIFGPALAPVISGIIVTLLSWRFIFLPPAIFCVILIVVGIFLVRDVESQQKISLDILSLILAVLGLFLLTYGLSMIIGQTVLAIACIIIAVILLGVFAVRQFRIKNPMLNLSPLRNRFFFQVCIRSVVIMMICFSMSV